VNDGFETVEGFAALIRTVRELYKRPRRRCTREDTPPILGCVQATQKKSLLVESIAGRLTAEDKQPLVAHVQVVLDSEEEKGSPPADAKLAPVTARDVEALRDVLKRTANGLAKGNGGSYRFPRFWLAVWLMSEVVPGGTVEDRRSTLRERLYQRAVTRASRGGRNVGPVKANLPVWVQMLWVILLPLFFWGRHSGKVPGIGRTYRWFLRQSDVPPGKDSFFELALQLTKDEWEGEKHEKVARLLVNAFLEDLRDDFRGAGWIHPYHTTFPVVLLEGITRRNGGYTLLRMVAEVRNDTRLFDPLLLVTTSRRVPPLAEPLEADASPADGARSRSLVKAWQRRMQAKSRQRQIEAWLIPITIGTPEKRSTTAAKSGLSKLSAAAGKAAAPQLSAAQPDQQGGAAPPERLKHVKRPWWRTRRGGGLIAFVALGLVGGGYAGFGFADDYRHCGDGFSWLGLEPATTSVTRIGGTCVGVTDGSNALLLPSSSFDEVRTTILSQNQRSLEVSKDQPNRPLITLVFMASANDQAASNNVLTAEREQLAGIAVAQAVQLAKPPQSYEPLLRVLIANAGPRLQHGQLVARQLGEMAAADPSIVAVVGMVESRQSTATTIKALAEVGLPTVAATLTADTMVDVSKLYFQISPQNAREAAVAAANVSRLLTTGKDPFGRPLARRARVYKSDDPTDTYSQNLAADLKASFTARGIPVETVPFTPSGQDPSKMDAGTAGRDACDAGGVVLYAARGLVDFQAFLGGIADRCRDQPPYVLAGDDVTKYVADRVVSGANRSVPFQYLSLALAPELRGEVPAEASDFYAQLNSVFPYETTGRGRTLDGHAALNYDAAYTVVVAVSYLRRDHVAINGGTVWTALQSMTDAGGAQRSYRGVTGKIDFGGTIGRRVPVDKPITIVTFRNGQPSAGDNLVCGARTDRRTKPWCPFDRGISTGR
jgi:hypothetical protein